ncbi:hypothetical protein [Jeongeupia chitinilytica]|uniref:hypothetical protein n=1 Tax=Jeongeupia chitinilytica TaxID=1041641 RepID=UPI001673E966
MHQVVIADATAVVLVRPSDDPAALDAHPGELAKACRQFGPSHATDEGVDHPGDFLPAAGVALELVDLDAHRLGERRRRQAADHHQGLGRIRCRREVEHRERKQSFALHLLFSPNVKKPPTSGGFLSSA